MRILKLILPLLAWSYTVLAQTPQAPQYLRVDLLRKPERVYKDGSLTALSLKQALLRKSELQYCTVNSRFPMLSWVVPVGRQAAYQVLMATSKELLMKNRADWWNSGRINSAESVSNIYHGKPLKASRIYYWKVRTWDKNIASPYSTIQAFATSDTLKDFELPSFILQKHPQEPVTVKILNNTHQLYDFGKDAFGQLVLTVSAAKGDTLIIHLGEALEADGSINRKPPGTVRYQLIKLPLVAGAHSYNVAIAPDKRNTGPKAILMPAYIGEVLPFRYAEIEALPGVQIKKVSRSMVTADFDEEATGFSSSDTSLNRIWNLCKYTIKATTFTGFYVDGDRERIPYEADALIDQLSHYSSDAEFTMAKRSLNYLIGHPTWPTEWSLQNVLIAWNDYLYSGDDRLMRQLYTDLKSKMLITLAREDGLISTQTGKQTRDFLKSIHFQSFNANDVLKDIVDWPQPGSFGMKKGEGGETDGFVFTDYNAVVNAYYYQNLKVMQMLSQALGYKADAAHYQAEGYRVKASFLKTFIDANTGLVHDGEGTAHSSLHANAFALAFGLIPADRIPEVVKFIRSRGMACSVYGAQFLLDGLAAANDPGYALNLINSRNKRSWFNMLNEGATMTMEAWGQEYKPNQDWNHAWGTAPANYIVRHLMGVQPLDAGFRAIEIKPRPGQLKQASLNYMTIRGKIGVDFKNTSTSFEMNVKLPGNTMPTIYLPCVKGDGAITMDGHTIQAVKDGDFWKISDIQSRGHRFVVERSK